MLSQQRDANPEGQRHVSEGRSVLLCDIMALVQETGFFATWGGSWDTPYGRFFLDWYHKNLLSHGERLLQAITSIFHTKHPRRCTLSNHLDATQSIVATGRPL